MFNELISRLRPANKDYNFMEIKELSEIMEAAKGGATYHVMLYFKAVRDYEAACEKYGLQCKKPRIFKGFCHGQS